MSPFFLALPRELRNLIYHHLLTRSFPVSAVPYPDSESCWVPPTPSPRYPSILRVCKPIHHEAHTSLYSSNKFNFYSCTPTADGTLPFLNQIGSASARLIRDTILDFGVFRDQGVGGQVPADGQCPQVLDHLFSACTGLQVVRLDSNGAWLWTHWKKEYARANRWLRSGIPSLRRIVIQCTDRWWDDEERADAIHGLGWEIELITWNKKPAESHGRTGE